MNHEKALALVKEKKIVAILRNIPLEDSIPVARALYAGGIRVMEFTYDHALPGCMEINSRQVESVCREFGSEMLVGCGTVLTEEEVQAGFQAGARLIVSPNTDEKVIRATKEKGMLSMPGAMTPTEIITAHKAGADIVKIFPAGALGLSYIKAVRAPLPHIPMSAVGGVKPENVPEFLDAGAVGFGIGSELVQKDALAARDFAAITRRALAYTEAIARYHQK